MRRVFSSLLVAGLAVLLLTSCQDDRSLTGPRSPVLNEMGEATSEDLVTEVGSLIEALFPEGGLLNAAQRRWGNIQRKYGEGNVDDAKIQAMEFAGWVAGQLTEGHLRDPDPEDYPSLPGSAELAVQALAVDVMEFVGYETPDIPEDFFESQDFGIGVVTPDQEVVVTTEQEWAAVVAEPGATEEPVLITIQLLDDAECAETGGLTTASGCWEVNRYPEGEFLEDVVVETCVADPDMNLEDWEWNHLLLHKYDEGIGVTALPWAEPQHIDCTNFDPTLAAPPQAPQGLAQTAWTAVSHGLADLLLPDPLGAAYFQETRIPRGLGGLVGSFSEFFGAVPESARPNLVSWWPADGDYYDMFGGNHGTPVGSVSFVDEAVSGSAFAFHGPGDEIVIEPLSDKIRNMQELTVATWVNLDPEGPADEIQRFVTLGPEKAVLRQEGIPLTTNRMLHFYMAFEEYPDLQHIWVDNAFQTGCYHFFVGTYDGQDMRAYLDGVEVGDLPVPGGTVIQGDDVAWFGSTAEPLYGDLDEIMIFDRALSPAEIAEIHAAGGPLRCQPASPATSEVTIDPTEIQVGESAVMTLQAKDDAGDDIGVGGATVFFTAETGALTGQGTIGPVTDNLDGTYTASFTATASGTPISISATVEGQPVTTPAASLSVIPAALTAEEAEAMIGGSFWNWWWGNHGWGPGPILSVAADEHTSSWRNFGMEDAGMEPRKAFDNDPSYRYAQANRNPWILLYDGLASLRDAMRAVEDSVAAGRGGPNAPRSLAFGKFVQGLSLGTLALVFDQAFILDEETDLATVVMTPYSGVMDAARAKLEEAITTAQANTFTTPTGWLGPTVTITNQELVAIARSFEARFMAQVPRTPAERVAVDWTTVLALANQGITTEFSIEGDGDLWWDVLKTYAGSSWVPPEGEPGINFGLWGRLDYRYLGPADQSGAYQAWLATPLPNRWPFLIDTDDARITGGGPQIDGSYVRYLPDLPFRADRGAYHQSYYGDKRWDTYASGGWDGPMVEMTPVELDYLRAEAMYRGGNTTGALTLVNLTRVSDGDLPAIPGAGGDQSTRCVPRDENGDCQNLWAALKYEKRLEVYHTGMGIAFFDDRGWGDLVDGTFNQLPVPGSELVRLGKAIYTFGGSEPLMVAGQAVGPATGPIPAETLVTYWRDLRERAATLKEAIRSGRPTAVQRQ